MKIATAALVTCIGIEAATKITMAGLVICGGVERRASFRQGGGLGKKQDGNFY
jgi:hypothetical protein